MVPRGDVISQDRIKGKNLLTELKDGSCPFFQSTLHRQEDTGASCTMLVEFRYLDNMEKWQSKYLNEN